MSTQQTEALQCAADLEYSIARHGMQDAFTLNAYRAMKMVRTQHARITELESQLAQRFDAADMLELIDAYAEARHRQSHSSYNDHTKAARQAVKDALAAELAQSPPTAQSADSVQEDAARLDFLIEQRAYVVSDPDACPGYWLHWARPDGRTWVQGDEHPTPRAAIDAGRKQGARWQSAVRALTLHI